MPTVKVLHNGARKYAINVTGDFAGDGSADLTNSIIINRSDLTGPDGVNIPGRIRIDEITWSNGVGYDWIKLSWDDATDEVIEYFHGPGYMDYRPYGGKSMTGDPTTDTEGDVLMSTSGGAAGDSYSLLINCTLKN